MAGLGNEGVNLQPPVLEFGGPRPTLYSLLALSVAVYALRLSPVPDYPFQCHPIAARWFANCLHREDWDYEKGRVSSVSRRAEGPRGSWGVGRSVAGQWSVGQLQRLKPRDSILTLAQIQSDGRAAEP